MSAARRPLQGTIQILQYNLGAYMAGGGALIVAVVALVEVRFPTALFLFGLGATSVVAWWLFASIAASYWIYDASPLMRWSWLGRILHPPRRWTNLHAGLDESTPGLSRLWGPPARVIDFFDEEEMTEKSILRARRLAKNEVEPEGANYSQLPLENGEVDLACVIFSAHELRSREARMVFFGEVARILGPGGLLLVIEHARDFANLVAFGPGFMHFYPPSEWRMLAAEHGFASRREGKFTPFVRWFVWEKS